VSLGAGALCRLLSERPDRFARVVFFLPAVLDRLRSAAARARLETLAAEAASGDRAAVLRTLAADLPATDRAAQAFLARQADALLAPGLSRALPGIADLGALPEATALRQVVAPALVLAARGDRLHPVQVAERLAALLPSATLHVYAEPGVLWHQRTDLRRRISGFLGA
ncbi:MAG: alpha/beta hydrolase, partial [Micromonosporaceae bacterium]